MAIKKQEPNLTLREFKKKLKAYGFELEDCYEESGEACLGYSAWAANREEDEEDDSVWVVVAFRPYKLLQRKSLPTIETLTVFGNTKTEALQYTLTIAELLHKNKK